MSRRPIDFGRLRELVQPIAVLERVGWKYRRRVGDIWEGRCLIHDSQSRTSRSFHCSTQWYRCHKCGAHGDVTQLYAILSGRDNYAAAVEMCQEFGLDVPYIDRD